MELAKEYSILIVDDEAMNLFFLNKLLMDKNNILTAKNGKDALEIASAELPDLIVLDIIMPGMDGYEVLAELKESEVTKDIPVIIVTGLDRTEDEQRGFELGAVDYITKPFSAAIVKARVEAHLKIVKQIRTIERFGLLDALTEIPNRRSFDNQLNIEWGRAKREKTPISIFLMDLDNFKDINDTYGHQRGDEILKGVTEIFSRTLRRTTDLLFRWGGDEFAVILPNTNINGAIKVAENIRENIENSAELKEGGGALSVTVSIGINCAFPRTDDSYDDFIENADKALYAAKSIGKNRWFTSLS